MSDKLKRVELTPSQAKALADIYVRKDRVEKEWETALALVGIAPDTIRAGNLADDPHLMVEDDDAGSS